MLDLGFSAINSMDVREISAPHLRRLSDETGHTVNLAILDGIDVVYIERCRTAQPGQREIDLNLHVGARLPAYCTAMGKAILAFVPEDRREELIARIDFVPRGPNTITDPEAFRAELARIRAAGIAVNDEELAYGLRSIAAPIHAHSGEVLAALNLAIHRTMGSMDELIARFAPAVKKTADDISLGMGHRLVPGAEGRSTGQSGSGRSSGTRTAIRSAMPEDLDEEARPAPSGSTSHAGPRRPARA